MRPSMPLALILAIPGLASAATSQFAADLGIGRSDNIGRSVSQERSSTITSAGLQFSIYENSRKAFVDLVGDLAFFDYSGSTYSSDLLGNIGANARFVLAEDHVEWVLQDNFGQTRRDLFIAPSPDNTENVNSFSTGPNFALRLASATSLKLQARYNRVDYQDSPFDSNRYTGSFAVERDLSSASQISLNASHEHIALNSGSFVGSYDRDSAFARLAAKGARNTLSLDAGATRADLASGSNSGALVRLSLSRKVGQLSVLTVEAGREITDSAGTLGAGVGNTSLSGTAINTLTQSPAPFTRKFARAGVEITGRRTLVQLGATLSDESYFDQQGVDRSQYLGTFGLSRQLGSRLSLRAGYTYRLDDFHSPETDINEGSVDLGLSWQAGRQLGVEATLENFRRHQDGVTGSAHENRAWLRLRYGASSLRAAGHTPAP